MLTSDQIRAARAFLRWDQATLAKAADVSIETIKRLERMDGSLEAVRVATLSAIIGAFEAAGIEFLNSDKPGLRQFDPKSKRKRE